MRHDRSPLERRRPATMALLAVSVVIVVSGCSSAQYDADRELSGELKLSSSGKIAASEEYGNGGFSSSAPTLEEYVSGDGPAIKREIENRLRSLNFRQTSLDWSGRTGGHGMTVVATLVQPGEVLTFNGSGKTVRADKGGVFLTIADVGSA